MSTRIALAAAVGAVFALVSAFSPAADPDAFWHVALGGEMLREGPWRVDAYSWTAAGTPLH